MRPLALFPLLIVALAGCDTSTPDGGLSPTALAGPWNGTLLHGEAIAGLMCDGEPVEGVTLAFDLRSSREGTGGLSGTGSLQLRVAGRACSTELAELTGATYAAPHLYLEFGSGFALSGEVSERESLGGLYLSGELGLSGGEPLAFSVAQGASLFMFGNPFGSSSGGG